MSIQLVYQLLNIVAIIAVFVMVFRTFLHLEAMENRALFLALIGLILDVSGQFSISNADSLETAGVGLRTSISGVAIFGVGFILYMITAFKGKHIVAVNSLWLVSIVGAFAHGFFIGHDSVFLVNARVIKIHGIGVLYGERGIVYWIYFAGTLLLCIWGVIIAFNRVRMNTFKADKRERILVAFYIAIISIHSGFLVAYEVFYGDMPYMLHLVRVAGTVLYFAIAVKYTFQNYDVIAKDAIVEGIGIGFMVVSDKYEVLYANEVARHLGETSRRLSNDLSIKDIIEKREYQIVRGGSFYRVSAERLYKNGKLIGYSVLITDITDIVSLERQAERSARARGDLLSNISHELRTPLNAILGATEMMLQDNTKLEDSKRYSEVIREGALTINDLLADILEASEEKQMISVREVPFSVATLINNIVGIVGIRVFRKKISFSVSIDPNVPLYAKGDDRRIRQAITGLLISAIRYTDEGSVNFRITGSGLPDGRYEYDFLITDLGNNPFANDSEITKRVDAGEFEAGIESSGYEIGMNVARKTISELGGSINSVSLNGRGNIFRVLIPCQIIDKFTMGDFDFEHRVSVVVFGDAPDYKNDITDTCSEYGIRLDFINSVQNLRRIPEDDKNPRILLFDYNKYSKKILSSEKAKKYIKVGLVQNEKTGESIGNGVQFANRPVSILTIQNALMQSSDLKADDEEMPTKQFIAPQAKILVVDDNSLNVQFTYSMLEQFGIIPDSAECGYECLDLLKSGKKYDLIFMDYMMDGMDGVETTANIRKMPGDISKVPIVAFTANVVAGAREKYLDGGMDDCIFKPATINDFEQMLTKFLPKEKLIYETGVREKIPKEPYPEIEGVDKKTAMKYTGGNVNIFTDMLVSFANDIKGRSDYIIECAGSEDWRNFIIQVHGVKGVARTLGMLELSDRMAKLEEAVKGNDFQYVNSNLPELLSYYRKFNKILMPYIEAKANERAIYKTDDSVGKILVQIHEALDEFEIDECEKLFNTIWPGEYEENVNSLMRGLKESIDNIDYYASLDYVERLLDTYNKKSNE